MFILSKTPSGIMAKCGCGFFVVHGLGSNGRVRFDNSMRCSCCGAEMPAMNVSVECLAATTQNRPTAPAAEALPFNVVDFALAKARLMERRRMIDNAPDGLIA